MLRKTKWNIQLWSMQAVQMKKTRLRAALHPRKTENDLDTAQSHCGNGGTSNRADVDIARMVEALQLRREAPAQICERIEPKTSSRVAVHQDQPRMLEALRLRREPSAEMCQCVQREPKLSNPSPTYRVDPRMLEALRMRNEPSIDNEIVAGKDNEVENSPITGSNDILSDKILSGRSVYADSLLSLPLC